MSMKDRVTLIILMNCQATWELMWQSLYRRNNWQAAININNLFDVEYFESVNYGRLTIQPGVPFAVIRCFFSGILR